MQTIWSRIAQARGSCRCPQCSSVANGISRRAGAAATQRGPKYIASSTLWYSGIFAAAATWDAGFKQQRREKWDRAIAEVKSELKETETDAAAAEVVNYEETKEHQELNAGMEDVDVMEAQLLTLEQRSVEDAGDVFEGIEPGSRINFWPTNTGTSLKQHRLAPESVYAKKERTQLHRTRNWSPKKVEAINLAIDILQLKIFIRFHNERQSSIAAESVPKDFAQHLELPHHTLLRHQLALEEDLRRLWKSDAQLTDYWRRTNGLPLGNYQNREGGETYSIPRELNDSLQRLFKQHKEKEIQLPSMLAQICYCLSKSPAPPNLDTLNILMIGFSEAKQSGLVGDTIKALRTCHLRPNEVSLTTILNHYTDADYAEGFVRWIEIMRGKHNGLALARPDSIVNEGSKGRVVPKEGEPDKLVQLPHPTPMVFSAVIRGTVKFGGFDTALNVCKNMAEEGWGICMSGLSPLLKHCAQNKDWSAGLAVWEQIKNLEAMSRRHTKHGIVDEKIPLPVLASMLRLCIDCGQREYYEDVWRQAATTHRRKVSHLAGIVKQLAEETDENESVGHPGETNDGFHEVSESHMNLSSREYYDTLPEDDTLTPRPVPAKDRSWGLSKASKKSRAKVYFDSRDEQVSYEELHGTLSGNSDLDDYEMHERPMSMSG